MNKAKIIVDIPKNEHKQIKKFAEEEKRTIASLTRKSIYDYIKKIKEQK